MDFVFVLGLASGPPTLWLISPEQLARVLFTTQHSVLIFFGLLVCFAGYISCILSVDQQILGRIQKLLLCPGIIVTVQIHSLVPRGISSFTPIHPSVHPSCVPASPCAHCCRGCWGLCRRSWSEDHRIACFRTVGGKQRTWREATHIQEATGRRWDVILRSLTSVEGIKMGCLDRTDARCPLAVCLT